MTCLRASAIIFARTDRRTTGGVLNKKALEIITLKEVVIFVKEDQIIIKEPSIDARNTIKISKVGTFSFVPQSGDVDDWVGNYFVEGNLDNLVYLTKEE